MRFTSLMKTNSDDEGLDRSMNPVRDSGLRAMVAWLDTRTKGDGG